jgi:hypothetical protein
LDPPINHKHHLHQCHKIYYGIVGIEKLKFTHTQVKINNMTAIRSLFDNLCLVPTWGKYMSLRTHPHVVQHLKNNSVKCEIYNNEKLELHFTINLLFNSEFNTSPGRKRI